MKIVARGRKWFRGKEGEPRVRRRIDSYAEGRVAKPDAAHEATRGLAADCS